MTKHGDSGTRLYSIWYGAMTRCYSSRRLTSASRYRGCGISMCAEWRSDFAAFRDWAHANGYRDDLELDRKDCNGNYEPSNCRWATRSQQMQNSRKRKNAKTSQFKGVSKSGKRWRVQICIKGRKSAHLGLFSTELEAALAYDSAATEAFGEFALLNFPDCTAVA